ncbi:MAG: hypothetical protein ACRDGV_06865 [Candidatus Limnocylindria bacterium]
MVHFGHDTRCDCPLVVTPQARVPIGIRETALFRHGWQRDDERAQLRHIDVGHPGYSPAHQTKLLASARVDESREIVRLSLGSIDLQSKEIRGEDPLTIKIEDGTLPNELLRIRPVHENIAPREDKSLEDGIVNANELHVRDVHAVVAKVIHTKDRNAGSMIAGAHGKPVLNAVNQCSQFEDRESPPVAAGRSPLR